MTNEEMLALEWLDNAIHRDAKWESVGDEMHRATLKAMLAAPRLPEEPTNDALYAMRDATSSGLVEMKRAYRALYAHLTKPATKFGVSAGMGWVHFKTLDEAMAAAKAELAGGNEVQIREVPA